MTVVTRFAPSPTGFLHIGGARTALFSWLFARKHHGRFLLRIEDTDRERSTAAASDAIIDGMQWLGLDWDGDIVHQFARAGRHAEVANILLAGGHAYRCYTSQEELAALRSEGKSYDRKWRDPQEAPPEGSLFVVRLKSPLDGEVVVRDQVRGEVSVPAGQLEDLVILRSDGTPTYNLAVVVDDHDMGVTHIIRGEDHLTNAAKQVVMYQLMGWAVPEFAHVPMIHGADGAKLSKRHGALGVGAYRDMGYLPEAVRNYLLRLGWSHGDDEIISAGQALEWFSLDGIGKSPSRFDFAKLESLNGHYIRESDDARLVEEIIGCFYGPRRFIQADERPYPVPKGPYVAENIGRSRLLKGMQGLKQRAKTLGELAQNAGFYLLARPIALNDKARALCNEDGQAMLKELMPLYEQMADFSAEETQGTARHYAQSKAIKLGDIAQPLRAALSGSSVSPGVFDIMAVLGKDETLARLRDVC